MQREKASSEEFADPPAFVVPPEPVDEPPEPVDDGLPLHAGAATTTPTVTARTPARRDHPRHRPRSLLVSPFIMSSTSSSGTRCRYAWKPVVRRGGYHQLYGGR
jgi:hypothetical protein